MDSRPSVQVKAARELVAIEDPEFLLLHLLHGLANILCATASEVISMLVESKNNSCLCKEHEIIGIAILEIRVQPIRQKTMNAVRAVPPTVDPSDPSS